MICCSMKMGSDRPRLVTHRGHRHPRGGPMLAGGWTETGGMFGVPLMGMDLGTGVGILVTEQLAVSDGETVGRPHGPGPWLWASCSHREGAFLQHLLEGYSKSLERAAAPRCLSVLFSMEGVMCCTAQLEDWPCVSL